MRHYLYSNKLNEKSISLKDFVLKLSINTVLRIENNLMWKIEKKTFFIIVRVEGHTSAA